MAASRWTYAAMAAMLIAPGSLHASGIYYTFAGDWTREGCTMVLARLAAATDPPAHHAPAGTVADRGCR